MADHHGQKFDVVDPRAKHLVNIREVHLQTVLVFFRGLLELDELLAGKLEKILGGFLVDVEVSERGGPLVASCETDRLEREAVTRAEQNHPGIL